MWCKFHSPLLFHVCAAGMGHKDHIQPALIGGEEDERRAGGQDDARPMNEQLDVIGDHEEEKQAGGVEGGTVLLMIA